MPGLTPAPKFQTTDSAGAPLAGGKVYTYDAGTTTPRVTYSDSAGLVPNTNPIILDSRGEAVIFLAGSYKIVLKDALDATIWTVDNVIDANSLNAALISQLSNTSLTTQGAGMIGLNQTLTYLTSTFGRFANTTVFNAGSFPWLAVGDGVADDTAALQAAINFAAGRGRLFFPKGTYKISATLRFPSLFDGYGAGVGLTSIFMTSTAAGNLSVMQTGSVGSPRSGFRLSDMTIDYTASRWSNPDATLLNGDVGSRTLLIMYTDHAHVSRLKLIGARAHCLDISSSPYVEDAGDEVYSTQPSRYIVAEDIEYTGWGDDGITTHHSSDIWISRCRGYDPSGSAGQTGGVEIDDGSRNVYIDGCHIRNCEIAYIFKGHASGNPSPYNCRLTNSVAVNCCLGLSMRNSGNSGSVPSLEDYQTSAVTGFSRTAMGVMINGLHIIAPRKGNVAYTSPIGAMDIQAYTSTVMANVTVSEGTEDFGNKEYLAAGTITADALIKLYSGLRRIRFTNLVINGFRAADHGVRATSSAGGTDSRLGVFINGFISRDGPKKPIYFPVDSVKDVYIDDFYISGNQIGGGTYGIFIDGDSASDASHIYVGKGRVTGYDFKIWWNNRPFTYNAHCIPTPLHVSVEMHILGVSNAPVSQGRVNLTTTASSIGVAVRASADTERIAMALEDSGGTVVGKISTNASRPYFYVSATQFITGGTGSPEGVVTAPVGCMFLRDNGAVYRKTSGAGNTGWVTP